MAPPPPSTTARNALVLIAVVVTGAALHWMGEIITPLLLAMFLAVMVDGFTRVIRTRAPALPVGAATLIAILASMILVAGTSVVVAANASSFIATLSRDQPKLNILLAQVATRLGPHAPASVNQLLSRFDPMQYMGSVAQALQNFGSAGVLVLIYLGFLIASRHAFERKAVMLFATREARHEALNVFLHIRDSIERYLWIQTVTGLMISTAAFGVMTLMGLEHAFFWAFLVFILNYVPILGAVAGIFLPTLFTVLQFGEWSHAAALLTILFGITFVVGNIFLPRMQGNSLNMDPLIVMMSLGFWGSIWGLPGMFLSTPLTVLAMVILAQFDGSRWIAILLSGDGDPQALGRGAEDAPDSTAAVHHQP
ncbi:MAG TPA: AI-2E family transporter [Caulobacteraceae bacterium]|jgi:predicted PurR-regulated permease PerM|nr:AI-2E family transporter [Caulobacteraceae bacterium]